LNAAEVSAGDVVMGTLPFDAAAEACRRGAGFYALILALREEQRGRDLSADDLEAAKARLQQYDNTAGGGKQRCLIWINLISTRTSALFQRNSRLILCLS
jgi:putative CRISPR-associated protein (TIGR02620 family)